MSGKGGMSIPIYSHQRFLKYHRFVGSFQEGCPSSLARIHDTKGGDVRRLAVKTGTISYDKDSKRLALTESGSTLVAADNRSDEKALSLVLHDLISATYPQYEAFIEVLIGRARGFEEILDAVNEMLADSHIVLDQPGLRSLITIGKNIGLVTVSSRDKMVSIRAGFSDELKKKIVLGVLEQALTSQDLDSVHTSAIVSLVDEKFVRVGLDVDTKTLFEVVRSAISGQPDYAFKYGVGEQEIPAEYAIIVKSQRW